MNYYFLGLDKDYTDIPKPSNWYGKIDVESVLTGKYENLDEVYVFEVKENSDLYLTDVIIEPVFAVSKMVKHCMEVYEPNMMYTQLCFIQRKDGKILEYFMPHLSLEKCLKRKNVIDKISFFSGRPAIDINAVEEDKFIFRVSDGISNYVVTRIELLESMLRRGAKGLQLEVIEVM